MKKIYFRILAICLSLVLSFTILYKDSIQADALEWVGVAVGYDTAFKFLLGLLGVSVGVGVAQEVDWGTLRQNAIQVQLDQGNSQAEVSAWWSNVIHGSLDTASNCWASFKDYVSSLVSSSSGGGSVSYGSPSEVVKSVFPEATGITVNFNVSCAAYFLRNSSSAVFYIYESPANISDITNSNFIVNGSQSINLCTITVNRSTFETVGGSDILNVSTPITQGIVSGRNYYFLGSGLNEEALQSISSNYHIWTGLDIPIESDFDSVYSDIGDIALNPENADTLATDVIPLPWENIGASDTDIEGIIDDAISRVIDGTLSLENYWEYVQNITNTYAYSIENNYLLPNENGEDKKADDKVKENAENGAFVLYGLEKVFPFCIPFDIYAFITLLKADPVAPVIQYPIYNPVTQENEIITIDFSEWESVVVIFRYIFDFLLIIGLLLLARPLVGAGGDS